jgi:hypothetical protein
MADSFWDNCIAVKVQGFSKLAHLKNGSYVSAREPFSLRVVKSSLISGGWKMPRLVTRWGKTTSFPVCGLGFVKWVIHVMNKTRLIKSAQKLQNFHPFGKLVSRKAGIKPIG